MELSQENGNTNLVLVTGGPTRYIVDGYVSTYNHAANTATMRAAQTGPAPGSPYQKTLQMWVVTAGLTSPAAGDWALPLFHSVEGQRWAYLNYGGNYAMPVTISFWITSVRAGNVALAVRNGATNRSYLVDVPVVGSSNSEYKSFTIPGDVAGTWDRTTGVGAYISICGVVGSTYQGVAGGWQAGNFLGTSATSNLLLNANDAILVSGFTVLPGSQAPLAAYSTLLMRPVSEELWTAQRYWCKSFPQSTLPAQNAGITGSIISVPTTTTAGSGSLKVSWPRTMRAGPTVTTFNPSAADGNWWDTNASASRTSFTGEQCDTGARFVVNATSTAGGQHFIHYTASSRL
jgi:hypothetical protein